MFLTITPMERPLPRNPLLRMWRRVVDKINPPATEFRRIEVCGGAFTDVRVYTPGAVFPDGWRGSQRLSAWYALCPPGYDLPQGCLPAVSAADVRRLVARVWCNTAVALLNESGLPLSERRMGFIDPGGEYPGLLEELIRAASEVMVCTENRALYQGYADKLLKEYGAPVVFVEEMDRLCGVRFVLHTGPQAVRGLGRVPVLSVWPDAGGEGGLVVRNPVFTLPQAEEVLPPGIVHDEFYAALWERSRAAAVGQLSMCSAICGKRVVTKEEIVQRIAQK